MQTVAIHLNDLYTLLSAPIEGIDNTTQYRAHSLADGAVQPMNVRESERAAGKPPLLALYPG